MIVPMVYPTENRRCFGSMSAIVLFEVSRVHGAPGASVDLTRSSDQTGAAIPPDRRPPVAGVSSLPEQSQ